MRFRPERLQRGVALVTALMVVSVATVAAVAFATRLQVDIRRTSNILDGDQAMLYALGAEAWAAQILARDRAEATVDHLGEDWATLPPPFSVEGGVVGARIEDLQGRLNLNNLIAEGDKGEAASKELGRLLETLELESGLADAIADWSDTDLEVRLPDGAEDDEYLTYEPPYRTGNVPMWSPSELRLVKGVTPEIYDKLASFITALPATTLINVNTASATVLTTVAEAITKGDAEIIVSDRGETGFQTVDDFLQHPALSGREISASSLSVSSDWFAVHSQAEIGRGRAKLFSILHRSASGQIKVVMRSRGGE